MKRTLRFTIADDDYYFRTVLSKEFISRPFYRMLFCAGDGMELIGLLGRQRPDLMLIDLYMPRMSGMEAIQIIRKTNKECPIIAYSSVYQDDVARTLHHIPNVFYCERDMDVIVKVAGSLFQREEMTYHAYSQEWKHKIPLEILPGKKEAQVQFNATELQIMSMTYDGYTNKEMADKLSFSPRTVDTYVERLLNKLELRNKADIVRYAVENGICKLHCEVGRKGLCDKKSIFRE
ncbi:response regulator transcription factor [Chitinophagaceae bacterium MMS25-I14]